MRRGTRSLRVVLCTFTALSCDGARPDARIPPRDGPLALELRYPTDGMELNRDSIAIWGTVGTGEASLRVNDREVVVERNGAFADFLPLPRADTAVLDFIAESGDDTRRQTIRILRRIPAAGASAAREAPVPQERWVVLRRARSDTADSATHARPIYSRWAPNGSLAVPLEQESRAFSDLRAANSIRLRLAPDVFVWVAAAETAEAGASPLMTHRCRWTNGSRAPSVRARTC